MASDRKSIKKLAKLGEGTAVFLTQEIKCLGWKQGDYVSVEVISEDKEPKVVLRKIKI